MIGQGIASRTLFASAVLGALFLAAPVASAATIQIINNNAANQGFNDPTARSPVGGNNGTSLGQQRLNVFQAAATLLGARLASTVTIQVGATFESQACDANGAILGSAGPAGFHRNFPNAPVANTFYPAALADSLAGSDLSQGASVDITATFNSAIGTTCPFPSVWYYGFDGNPGNNQTDLLSVVIHELTHGLGFLTLVDLDTGAKFNNANDTFMLNLENHGASPPDFPSMSDAQRLAASTATGNLHWTGANARAAGSVLTAGRVGDHIRMFAPSTSQGGSSVSHWDTVLTPNQVMEPAYTQPLHVFELELAAFKDIGWNVIGGTTKVAHDFNGDSKSDIFWRNTDGANAIWLMNGAAVASVALIGGVDTSWQPVGQRDFDGDGKTDILWRNSGGSNAIWFMNGATVTSVSLIGGVDTSWSVVGTADFNGDGKGDILWRNTGGTVAIWLMNGATVSSVAVIGGIGTNWSVAGTADFDGDGKGDILWRENGGSNAIWFMNGASIASVSLIGGVGTTWTVAGTADFNGDGKGDILWREAGGTNAVWFMNGATVSSVSLIGGVGTNWTAASVGDYNGDGKGDILWREAGGSNAVWFMNGGTVSSVSLIGGVATNWSVQNAGAN